MGYILGISAFYHDAAAALIHGDEIIAAAQEERFSRKKNDPRFPSRAINYCLGEAFIEPSELQAVVFYHNPLLNLDRIVKNSVSVAPKGREQFINAICSVLGPKAMLEQELESTLGLVPEILFSQHHFAHAASSFYPSPYQEAAILTIDGVGEWETCTLGMGSGNNIELLQVINYPHSLGLMYSAFTYFCGFKVNSGEYKLMGLAPYGSPRYTQLIRDKLIDIRADGSIRLNTEAFGFLDSGIMTNDYFAQLFGGPARQPETPISRREMDIAASIQVIVEDVVLKLVAHVRQLTNMKYLTMAGGVALNCVANGKILQQSGLDGLFVQPAAGDAGGALGAALQVAHQIKAMPRTVNGRDNLKGSLLGPAFSNHEVEAFLDRMDAVYHEMDNAEERAQAIAKALDQGLVVGLFNGRMEFGPRALGSRSILGDARSIDLQSHMNLKIKFRESFRPFAPVVLAEHAQEYFDIADPSPYMLFVAPVKKQRCLPMQHLPQEADDLLTVLKQPRSDIPAVTHVDYSARVQTVDGESNPELHRILQEFYRQTGCPVLVNTSFNVRGEPIVCSPQDAYNCFIQTDIDILILENFLLWKHEQIQSE